MKRIVLPALGAFVMTAATASIFAQDPPGARAAERSAQAATPAPAAAGAAKPAAANTAAAKPAGAKPAASSEQIARGKYIVTTSGCNDCHTPWIDGPSGPEPDMSRMLSGHPASLRVSAPAPTPKEPWLVTVTGTNTAWSGPWGVSFTANLTPDPETGLGRWTERNFKDTIRTGRHLGRGRKILPPMPIPMYKQMTDEDLSAVFAYLQSIPAIKNPVPEPLPPSAAGSAQAQ